MVRCKGAALHFWDAPDDILGADMDLVFERDRMYLHGAHVSVGDGVWGCKCGDESVGESAGCQCGSDVKNMDTKQGNGRAPQCQL